MTQSQTAAVTSIGPDIGTEVLHLVGFDGQGAVVLRRKIKRSTFEREFEKLPRCIVGMEACLSAHFVSRTLRRLGHEPRIIPAIYVKPFAKGQKNDYNDAETIAEAALRPNMRLVAEKSQAQLDLQALHRVRARLVSRRTATINQILSNKASRCGLARTPCAFPSSPSCSSVRRRCRRVCVRCYSASMTTGCGSTNASTRSPPKSRRSARQTPIAAGS